jgi:hypothetical protein
MAAVLMNPACVDLHWLFDRQARRSSRSARSLSCDAWRHHLDGWRLAEPQRLVLGNVRSH